MSEAAQQRRDELFQLLASKGRLRVNELAESLHVTTETIRKDLALMEERGLITKLHGCAEIRNEYHQLPLDVKVAEHAAEKQSIAQAVLPYISDYSTIFLDPGSTTLYIARYLRLKKGLIVVTNSLAIAQLLSEMQHELIFAGGKLQKRGKSMVGGFTSDIISAVNIDTAIMGCDGFMDGPTTFSAEELHIKQQVLKKSRTHILVCDSSKFQKHSTYTFARCSDYDYLITDALSTEDEKQVEGIKNIVVAAHSHSFDKKTKDMYDIIRKR